MALLIQNEEMAGNTTIIKIRLELGARGTLHTVNLGAIPVDDPIASLK